MLKKIKSWNIKICKHPEHEPPKFISLKPGVYEHTCPGCGQKKMISIRGFTMDVKNLNVPINLKFMERRNSERRLEQKLSWGGRCSQPYNRKYGRRQND